MKDMIVSEPRAEFTVVVPTYNNPSYLRMMIGQLIDLGMDHMVIVDNDSKIQGMRELLEEKSRDFIVVSKKTNDGPSEFYSNKEFYAWLPEFFIITDPDIGLNKNMPKDFLEIMKEASHRFNLFRVGLALDIEMEGVEHNMHEIVFRNSGKSMHQWESQFWRDVIGKTKNGDDIYGAAVDTTFCMVNKSKDTGEYFRPSARIAGNFTAQHYGWYKNPPIPKSENEFYLNTIPKYWSETGNAIKARESGVRPQKPNWKRGGFDHLFAFIRQNPEAIDVFQDFFSENKFNLVIEIGTDNGGLSMVLKDECDKMGAKFETYEIKEDAPARLNKNKQFEKRKIDLKICNVFQESTINSIAKKIKESGRVLLLCDGGNKIKEFNTYSKFLKPEDVIMAHDYAIDESDFKKNIKDKIWNWHEIRESDISSACEENNLVDFFPKFRSVVWVCKIKK
jgi:hypothetical protein